MKKKANLSIKKSISHLNKVATMLEEDAYCIDVIQQILAVQGYLKSAQKNLLENHLNSCYKDALHSNNPREEERVLKELLSVISKIYR